MEQDQEKKLGDASGSFGARELPGQWESEPKAPKSNPAPSGTARQKANRAMRLINKASKQTHNFQVQVGKSLHAHTHSPMAHNVRVVVVCMSRHNSQ